MKTPAPSHAPFAGIDPTPLIQIAQPKGHRPCLGKYPRVILSSARVDVKTHKRIAAWMKRAKVSLGIYHDQVAAFAHKRGFKPVRAKR